MQHQKLLTVTLVAGLLTSSLAMAAPPPGPDLKEPRAHGKEAHHSQRITPVPRAAPRHRLAPGTVKVRIGGTTLWVTGSTYYRWQPKHNRYIPVAGHPTIRTTTIINGPYYNRLPAGASAVIIQGTRYFNHRGKFYLPVERHGRTAYIRVRF